MDNGVKLIDNYIYIYHLEKFCVLPTYPESITDHMAASFETTTALSRSAPVFSYKNSGPRQVQVNLQLHRDMMNDINTNISNLKDNVVDFSGDDYVDTLVRYLQACALPRYNPYSAGSKSVIPPMVAVRFGNDVFIKGVINSDIMVTRKKPIMSNGKYALIEIGFNVSETDPYDADSVAAEGSFRGLTRTFKDGIYKPTTEGPLVDDLWSIGNTTSDGKPNGESQQRINQLVIGG